jgi:4-hydroxythreonine-4-phosphate dehydrogenase
MTTPGARLVVVSMGDPAGIGREVILKAAAALARKRHPPALAVVGDLAAMSAASRDLGISTPKPFGWARSHPLPRLRDGLAVIDVGRLRAATMRAARPSVAGGDAAYRYIVEGSRMALAGEAGALVTAPINKDWMNRAGHHFPGHSELIAGLAKVRDWRMMFAGTQLRIALATVHIGLAQVAGQLSVARILGTIRLLNDHLRRQSGIDQPRIAVLGLNPHAGENGLFGSEERQLITPAIRRAQRAGIKAFGPLAPDTAFIRREGRFGFDGAVAMYHDQGLIALKTLEFDRAVNITLGLPFVRTSPDHGTAYDIAGRGLANPASMIAAIEYAAAAVRSMTNGADTGVGAAMRLAL